MARWRAVRKALAARLDKETFGMRCPLSLSLTGWFQVGFYPAPIPGEAS